MLLLLFFAQLAPEVALVDELAGEYRWKGGAEDQRAVEQAIDRVVSDMGWIARGMARRRLLDTNRIPPTLSIAREGERVRIDFGGRTRETSLAARPVPITASTGDEMHYTLEVLNGRLVQRFEGKRGGRINEIRAEGDDLVVKVTIFSNRLPANVVYELRYTRAS